MPIDFSNVSISIEQFQEISSGKYNAGEVRLSSENTLAKMNNHVHLWGRNVDTISHEETLTIKEAFVRALANSGVGQDALNTVRSELGLAPDGKADRTLTERSLKPLSRQQIREILDRNAMAINLAKGIGTIVTDAQMHTGEKSAVHAIKRDMTNAATEASRTPSMNVQIARAQLLIGGDVEFQSSDERKALLELAQSQKTCILIASGNNPSRAPNSTVSVLYADSNSGLTISTNMQLGMSEADYVERLTDVIMRLTEGTAPSEEELAVRTEFKSLQSADRDALLAQMSKDPAANGLKARAVAVMLMQEHGVNDFESLSLVNQLNDANALMLATSLSRASGSLKGSALLQSADIRPFADLAASRPADVPDGSQATIPGLSARDYNETVFMGLIAGSKSIPRSFSAMTHEIGQDIAARLGPETLDESSMAIQSSDNLMPGLAHSPDLNRMIPHDDDNVSRVTADSIRAEFKKCAFEKAAQKFIANFVNSFAAQRGLAVPDATPVTKAILDRSPELLDQLAACKSPDEARAMMEAMSADMRFHNDIMREQAINECMAFAETWALQALASELDLGINDVSMPQDVATHFARAMFQQTERQIHSGEVKASTPEEVRAAFSKTAAKFASDRAGALSKLDAFQMSPQLRNGLRTTILRMGDPNALDLNALFAAAGKADFSEVVALANSKAKPEEIHAALDKFFASVEGGTRSAAEAASMEYDWSGLKSIITQIAVDRTPGGVKALESILARADIQSTPGITESQADNISYLSGALSARDGSMAAKRIMMRPVERAFLDGPGAVKAFEAGYIQAADLPMLARTYALCRAAGMGDAEAIGAALDPESKPRRLVRYGGRFTDSVEGFSQGLKLQGQFEEWFAKSCRPATLEDLDRYSALAPLMKNPSFAGTVERFVFEEIAYNTSIPLDATNPEDIFGVESNQAMRFIGSISDYTLAHAVSHTPPAMRGLVYETYNLFEPPYKGDMMPNSLGHHKSLLVTRTLENYAGLAALRETGNLTRESAIHLLFPELEGKEIKTNDDISRELALIGNSTEPLRQLGIPPTDYPNREAYTDAMLAKERAYVHLLRQGAWPSNIAFGLSSGTAMRDIIPIAGGGFFDEAGMASLRSPVQSERLAMKNLISTPSPPTWIGKWAGAIPKENSHFVFNFADGKSYNCDPTHTTTGGFEQFIDEIADKIEGLCGSVNQEQLAAVYRELSADGGAPLLNFFQAQGISTNARCPLVQTIAKDEATGTINIMHSNPKGFPFSFSWTTSIGPDGSVFSNPIIVGPAQTAQRQA